MTRILSVLPPASRAGHSTTGCRIGANPGRKCAVTCRRWAFRTAWSLLLLLGAAGAPAQSVLDGFNIGAGGEVRALAVQPDGKLLVGGGFTQFGGQTRLRLARVHYDGTLDSSFNVNINGAVNAIAVNEDGRIFIGGEFTQVAGQSRPFLAWINADGSLGGTVTAPNDVVHTVLLRGRNNLVIGGNFTQLGSDTQRQFLAGLRLVTSINSLIQDPLFRPPSPNGPVFALARQAGGHVIVGGNFTQIGGQPRVRLARLIPNATSTPDLDPGFIPSASGTVHALAVQRNGDIVLGGAFTQINGLTRNRIGRIGSNGSLDGTFSPSVNQPVRALAVQEDGGVLLGGEFTNVAGQIRNRIARLQANGALDTGFNPSSNGNVLAVVLPFDDKPVVGGAFTSLAGQTRNRIARLYPDGRLDRDLQPETNGVQAIAVQADGRILIGGSFISVDGQTRRRVARLHPDGSLDTSFNAGEDMFIVHAIAIRTDGRIYVAGLNGLARLNANGSRDTQFTTPSVVGTVRALAALDDGGVIAGGSFSQVNSTPRNNIARLNSFGTLATYNPQANGTIASMALQPDGKLLVGGNFTLIAGSACFGFARLTANGQFDPMVINQINPDVLAVTLQPDGRILVGGRFPTVGAGTPDKLMRLQSNGTRDTQFFQGGTIRFASDPAGQFGGVHALAVQADGKILIAGEFDRVNNQTRQSLARLHPNGSLDANFNIGTTLFGAIHSLAGQRDGKWLFAGPFSGTTPASRNSLARLSADRSASERLSVEAGELRWLRQGSAQETALPPQVALSLDGQTFNIVATMTRIDGGWGVPGFAAPDAAHWLRITAPVHDGGTSSVGRLQSLRAFGAPVVTALQDPVFSSRFEQ